MKSCVPRSVSRPSITKPLVPSARYRSTTGSRAARATCRTKRSAHTALAPATEFFQFLPLHEKYRLRAFDSRWSSSCLCVMAAIHSDSLDRNTRISVRRGLCVSGREGKYLELARRSRKQCVVRNCVLACPALCRYVVASCLLRPWTPGLVPLAIWRRREGFARYRAC